jgi:hypothetical protein
MPRNVRNFWIELDVDGRTVKVAAGPKSKDGGFALVVKLREDGEVSPRELHVIGSVVDGDGTDTGTPRLMLHAYMEGERDMRGMAHSRDLYTVKVDRDAPRSRRGKVLEMHAGQHGEGCGTCVAVGVANKVEKSERAGVPR